MDELEAAIIEWAKERSIFGPDIVTKQTLKAQEELGELSRAVLHMDNSEIKSELGDVLVTLVILANSKGWTAKECLEMAYLKIKTRKGKTINKTFIKDDN